MNNEKQRLFLIVLVMFGWMLLMQTLGWGPKPAKPKAQVDPAKAAAKDQAGGNGVVAKADSAKPGESKPDEARPEGANHLGVGSDVKEPRSVQVALVEPRELVLGSATDKTPGGYRLQVQLEQKGAGVESVLSSRYDAEFEGRLNPRLPLELLRRDPVAPPSLSLTINADEKRGLPVATLPDAEAGVEAEADGDLTGPLVSRDSEDLLDSMVWEVVRDANGHVIRRIDSESPTTKAMIEGQEVVFRTTASNGAVITKTYRLWQTMSGFEVELAFESPDKERSFSYNLYGPHGIPIEGEWYTGTFREVFFGTYRAATGGAGTIKVETHTANDIAKATDKAIDSTTLPLRFTGVENQYFAAFLAPYPAPTSDEARIDKETRAILLHKDAKAVQKSDVGIRMTSRTIQPGPNTPVVHTFRVFAGPKSEEALNPYNASALASYRKSSFIPGASYVARFFITPTLSFAHDVTTWVARLFGRSTGNWGIAIILLTLFVKMLMFPLGRKQALMAQRTQQLQPYLKAIQEKHKDDKEQQTRETLALYKKHGVNPVSGCVPALIQLPIFVGLWQALNSSVSLRHSPFLWISDLAAPDMLARFPGEVPFLGHWFNLLPILVVLLMLIQTKLFSPPATTPEAEMQQKTMKYMMVFMAVMFYKVPAGLGIYFITSSLWSIGERLLLPKITHAAPAAVNTVEDAETRGEGARGKGSTGNGPAAFPKKPPGAFSQFMEKILDEARKDSTYRKMVEDRDDKDGGRRTDSDDRRDRDRGKPRARPGRK